MLISVHLLLAGALAVAGTTALLTADQAVRRLRHARVLRVAVLSLCLVLVPGHLWCALLPAGSSAILREVGVLVTLVAGATVAVALLTLRIAPAPAGHPRRVLAIGAHPDDLELACGATLAKLADSGHEVRLLVMSRGAEGGDPAVRVREAEDAGRLLGATSTTVLDLPDTRISEAGREATRAIEDAIHRWNPDIVLTHSSHDQHQDHRAVHEATMRAARRHSAVLCYESPSATREFDPSVFVDVGDHVEAKVAAVGAHRDQAGKPYMSAERVRGTCVHRGAQARVRMAEGFEPVRLLGTSVGDL